MRSRVAPSRVPAHIAVRVHLRGPVTLRPSAGVQAELDRALLWRIAAGWLVLAGLLAVA